MQVIFRPRRRLADRIVAAIRFEEIRQNAAARRLDEEQWADFLKAAKIKKVFWWNGRGFCSPRI